MPSFTTEQLEALEKAIAEGILSVKYSDKMITYRSLDEMLKSRDLMRRSLGLLNDGGRILPSTSKGFC